MSFAIDPYLDSLDEVGYALSNATGPVFEHIDAQLKAWDQSYGSLAAFARVPALEAQIASLESIVGKDTATLKYLLSMLAAYPLAMIFSMLPYGKIRHIFSAVTGMASVYALLHQRVPGVVLCEKTNSIAMISCFSCVLRAHSVVDDAMGGQFLKLGCKPWN